MEARRDDHVHREWRESQRHFAPLPSPRRAGPTRDSSSTCQHPRQFPPSGNSYLAARSRSYSRPGRGQCRAPLLFLTCRQVHPCHHFHSTLNLTSGSARDCYLFAGSFFSFLQKNRPVMVARHQGRSPSASGNRRQTELLAGDCVEQVAFITSWLKSHSHPAAAW